ncbi:WD repeat and FYVE domain-containing 3 isoform X1 [Brachionus plicatilis]|uniref:WD repeat and FYVE domain-containing 3 isoform X1 n=1 Tax=Brachionus plicatilis TaxID=10195 RepID=A0A3M7S6V4_BRAPC|nr:WD repeat and FYVE domain-containing 3 isoform X1 [Brachionus plicatilis]
MSNTAVQLQGASRTVGGVVTGYVDVRLFQPMPMSKSVQSLGGAGFLLALVAMATDVSPHVLNLTFSLAVCDDNGIQVSGVYNAKAFEVLAMEIKNL